MSYFSINLPFRSSSIKHLASLAEPISRKKCLFTHGALDDAFLSASSHNHVFLSTSKLRVTQSKCLFYTKLKLKENK